LPTVDLLYLNFF